MSTPIYYPEFFNPNSLEDAKFIVLCSNEQDYNFRWETETQWIKDQLISTRCIDHNSLILDWGTGVGRIAKMLIETFNCTVVGVDISESMLNYAIDYVGNSEKFIPITHDKFMESTFSSKFTCCIATWSLQHSNTSELDIEKIQKVLIPKGNMFVLEMSEKCVIGKENEVVVSVNDNVDNKMELAKWFNPLILGKLPRSITVDSIFDGSWWGFLEKK
jgi:ubiquinone/menaquinone biosynthesis C-methylase UbiE